MTSVSEVMDFVPGSSGGGESEGHVSASWVLQSDVHLHMLQLIHPSLATLLTRVRVHRKFGWLSHLKVPLITEKGQTLIVSDTRVNREKTNPK